MNIKWSPQALRDLASLRAFVAEDDPGAALRLVERIVDAIGTLLPEHPEIGRPGRVPGTRELVISRTPYIVPYRVRHGTLQILRVYHGARKWPDQL
jgi:toxin ParE1/3/4